MLAESGLESNLPFGNKNFELNLFPNNGLKNEAGRHHRALDLDYFDTISNRRRSLRKGLQPTSSDRMDNFLYDYDKPLKNRREPEIEFYGSSPGSGGYSTYFYESVPVAASKKTGVANNLDVVPQMPGFFKILENIFNVDFWISKFASQNENEVLEREGEDSEAASGKLTFN